jgi:hypothetical protein
MPDYFSHNILAQQIYEKLNKDERDQIESRTLFLLGAQGGDVFFFYNIHTKKNNIGVKMHRLNTQQLFEDIIAANKSYVAGFATHYAVDATLHPAIYAYADTAKAHFAHLSLENDLGLYCSKKYSTPRRILPREEVLKCTSAVYDTIKNVYDSITVTGVERCLKRHFLYTKFTYKTKRTKYKNEYDFTTLDGALEDAIELGVKAVRSILNGEVDENIFYKSFLEK